MGFYDATHVAVELNMSRRSQWPDLPPPRVRSREEGAYVLSSCCIAAAVASPARTRIRFSHQQRQSEARGREGGRERGRKSSPAAGQRGGGVADAAAARRLWRGEQTHLFLPSRLKSISGFTHVASSIVVAVT
jgi:hypothetical protein